MREHFSPAADTIFAALRGDESASLRMQGEVSDFVRFNHGRLRQATHVEQSLWTLHLVQGQRHGQTTWTATGTPADSATALDALHGLRADIATWPEDPFLFVDTSPAAPAAFVRENQLGHAQDRAEALVAQAGDLDQVGIYAHGTQVQAFRSSLGHDFWQEQALFNWDYSIYVGGDKATKGAYAGRVWDEAAYADRLAEARQRLDILRRTPKQISPGAYRVFLSPAALSEILSLLSWQAFGCQAQRQKRSSLLRLVEGKVALHPMVQLREHLAEGVSPRFGEAGLLRPAEIPLIKDGRHAGCLVSPRSAREYGLASDGSAEGEQPEALDMAGGDLPQAEVLQALGTGVYVGNLWYMNYSDVNACRMTGMTRFGTFWVENGQVVAPLSVMRFDMSLYSILGEQLLALTHERDFILDPATYDARSTTSWRLPGALVEDFRFTL